MTPWMTTSMRGWWPSVGKQVHLHLPNAAVEWFEILHIFTCVLAAPVVSQCMPAPTTMQAQHGKHERETGGYSPQRIAIMLEITPIGVFSMTAI